MTIAVTLPWPDKALSPNGRAHRMAKYRAGKKAKEAAWLLTLEALKGRKPSWAKAALVWTFHPKTANPVDVDNCIASNKAHQDGIAAALGIDDANFSATYQLASPIKGGAVLVTISEAKP